jgi:hypothetical protein
VLDALRSERYFALLATRRLRLRRGRDGGVSLRKAARKEFDRLAKAMDEPAAEPSDRRCIARASRASARATRPSFVEDDLGGAASG